MQLTSLGIDTQRVFKVESRLKRTTKTLRPHYQKSILKQQCDFTQKCNLKALYCFYDVLENI